MKVEGKVTLEGLSLYHYGSDRRREEKRKEEPRSEEDSEWRGEGKTEIASGHSSNIYQGSNI